MTDAERDEMREALARLGRESARAAASLAECLEALARMVEEDGA